MLDQIKAHLYSIKIKNSKSKLLITCETLIYKFELRIVDFK